MFFPLVVVVGISAYPSSSCCSVPSLEFSGVSSINNRSGSEIADAIDDRSLWFVLLPVHAPVPDPSNVTKVEEINFVLCAVVKSADAIARLYCMYTFPIKETSRRSISIAFSSMLWLERQILNAHLDFA